MHLPSPKAAKCRVPTLHYNTHDYPLITFITSTIMSMRESTDSSGRIDFII